jgi:hypothetical protein
MGRALRISIDVLGLVGVGAVVYGTWLVYPPAAWIIGGAAASAAAVVAAGRID